MSEASQSHDLRNRIFFTLFILSVYRFGTFVPIPGIDPEQLQIMMQGNLPQGSKTIDLSKFSPNVYFIQTPFKSIKLIKTN